MGNEGVESKKEGTWFQHLLSDWQLEEEGGCQPSLSWSLILPPQPTLGVVSITAV